MRSRVIRRLIDLETTECPDRVWPDFAAWLAQRPDRLELFLAAERTRQAVDELCRGCPRDVSPEAERLLRRRAGQTRRPRGLLAKWIVLSLCVGLGAAVGTLWVVV